LIKWLFFCKLGTWKTKMWYCQCDNKDGCNGSTNKRLSFLTILFGISLFFWQWKLNVQ
jgi:hypothetical protein